MQVDAGRARLAPRARSCRSSAAARRRERKPGSLGVDEDLLAGLGVLDLDRADVGQLDLTRVADLQGDHLVPLREPAERPLPARLRDEVGDDDDERPPAGQPGDAVSIGPRSVTAYGCVAASGGGPARVVATASVAAARGVPAVEQRVGDPQHLVAARRAAG